MDDSRGAWLIAETCFYPNSQFILTGLPRTNASALGCGLASMYNHDWRADTATQGKALDARAGPHVHYLSMRALPLRLEDSLVIVGTNAIVAWGWCCYTLLQIELAHRWRACRSVGRDTSQSVRPVQCTEHHHNKTPWFVLNGCSTAKVCQGAVRRALIYIERVWSQDHR